VSENGHMLSTETEVTLLLCGSFEERSSQSEVKPLTPGEYFRITGWLKNSLLTLTDLIRSEVIEQIPVETLRGITIDRLTALIERRSALDTAIERWQARGIWVLSPGDAAYPVRLWQRLERLAPPLLFGLGSQSLLSDGGLAIVGSRDADAAALEFTRRIAVECATAQLQVVSGGARGIDQEAMGAILDVGGKAMGILADSLGKEAAAGKYDLLLEQRRLTLLSPYHPDAGFSVGNAMGRNKCIYALADWSLVVSAAAGEGGSWAGAVENLKHCWTPMLVRDGDDVPEGNLRLIRMGGFPFPVPTQGKPLRLLEILDSCEMATGDRSTPQTDLFTTPDSD
jgi:predicted Rossmann fold nucleotide-binding protein DprA/Smf involved in DNA uptake